VSTVTDLPTGVAATPRSVAASTSLSRGLSGAKRFAVFGAIPAISLVTPLIAIPVIAHHFGQAAWASVAIGQSVGALGGIVVALGWPQVGAIMVAKADAAERAAAYRESLAARRAAVIVVAPVTALIAILLTRQDTITAALIACAVTANGLTAQWFYIGTGRGKGLLVNETAFRVATTLVACAVILAGGPLYSYPICLMVGQVAADTMNNKTVLGQFRARIFPSFGALRDQVRLQFPQTISRLVSGMYVAGAVTVVATVAPSAIIAFTAIDRVQKTSTNAASSLPQALTSWVAAPGKARGIAKRVRLATAFDVGLGAVTAAAFYLLLPLGYRLMFSRGHLLTPTIALLSSIALGLAIANRAVRMHALILLGKDRYAAWLTTTVALLGAIATGVGAVLLGAEGAVAAGVAAESVLFVMMMTPTIRTLRRGVESVDLAPITGGRRGSEAVS
jgi:O-antigen/teichoic acid export membrane protein